MNSLAPGASGNLLTSNGSAWVSSAATFVPATSGTAIQKANGSGGLTAAAATDVTGQLLTGYVSGAGTVSATDSILQGIQKLNGNIAAISSGVTTMGAFGSTPNANGASIAGSTLTLQPADTNNPGGLSTGAQFIPGEKTMLSAFTASAAGVANVPGVAITGAPMSTGTATSSKPQLLVETTGATSNNWNTVGTMMGVNAASGFTGDLFNLQNNATKQLSVAAGGKFVWKVPVNNSDSFCFEANASTSQYCWFMNGNDLGLEQGATGYLAFHGGWIGFSPTAATPLYAADFNQSSTSIAPLTDIQRNSATFNNPLVVSRNTSATVNNYSGFVTAGASTAATAPDMELLALHRSHTNGAETADFNLNLRNSGTIANVLSISASGSPKFPYIPTGLVKSTSGSLSIGVSGTDYQAPITTSGAVANQFVTGFTAPNTFTIAQPTFANIAGSIALTQMPQSVSSSIPLSSIDWSILSAGSGIYVKQLSSNTTFTFANAVPGQVITVRVTNTPSNYTVTWPTMKWPGGVALSMSTGAVSDVYTILSDGTNYYANGVQNFQ